MNRAAADIAATPGAPPNVRPVERADVERRRHGRRHIMKEFGSRGTVAVGLLCATVGLAAPARADTWEPTPPTVPFAGSSSASDDAGTVVSNLTSAGYRVILNKVGTAPLDKCKVTSVTSGVPITQLVTGGARALTAKVLYTTVYVTADCNSHTSTSTSTSAGG
jgi:hypothetical protein